MRDVSDENKKRLIERIIPIMDTIATQTLLIIESNIDNKLLYNNPKLFINNLLNALPTKDISFIIALIGQRQFNLYKDYLISCFNNSLINNGYKRSGNLKEIFQDVYTCSNKKRAIDMLMNWSIWEIYSYTYDPPSGEQAHINFQIRIQRGSSKPYRKYYKTKKNKQALRKKRFSLRKK
jgi:hypothetical protein